MTVIRRRGRKIRYSQLSVLVVDDQQFYRNLMNEIMRALGITNVNFAVDGYDAIDAMESDIPDMIFLDWMMPDMDGIEFTKKVRHMRNEAARMTPIIMVTSNNRKSQIEEAINTGVDTFVLKPLAIQSVIARVREIIEKPRDFVVTDSYIGPCRRRNKAGSSYFGKYRRADDPKGLNENGAMEKRAKEYIHDLTSGLAADLARLYTGDTKNISDLIRTAQKIMEVAKQIGDTQLSKICWSVITYLEKFGSSSKLRPDIVATHFQSIDALLRTPAKESNIRDEVVKELNKLVMRSISPNKAV